MSDAWNGVPQNPERDGWHWVQHRDNALEVLNWSPLHAWLYEGEWTSEGFIGHNYRYLGPCLTPAEVEARERACEAMREAACDVVQSRCPSAHAIDRALTVEALRALPTPEFKP